MNKYIPYTTGEMPVPNKPGFDAKGFFADIWRWAIGGSIAAFGAWQAMSMQVEQNTTDLAEVKVEVEAHHEIKHTTPDDLERASDSAEKHRGIIRDDIRELRQIMIDNMDG